MPLEGNVKPVLLPKIPPTPDVEQTKIISGFVG
jgi:hypothetical protein